MYHYGNIDRGGRENMQHKHSKTLLKYWDQAKGEKDLPSLQSFSPEVLAGFDECGVIFKLKAGEIILDYVGARNIAVLTSNLQGRPITDLFSHALKPLQMSLIMPCFQQKAGLVRTSRVWYGHRHKDVEWVLLPVWDETEEQVALVGLAVTFVPFDERDHVAVGSSMVERIIRQNFLSFQRDISLSVIDSHSWAVLDTMGAKICIDNEEVFEIGHGITGDAGLAANKVAHANVLAVAQASDFGRILSRLGARYNLKVVETLGEAREILRKDMIDVLVTTETVNDVGGLALIEEAQQTSAFTACVMMLDPRESAIDTQIVENGHFVQCLVKPVGEFALRKAVDEGNSHVSQSRQDNLSAS
jgi:hypothetical protein